MSVDKLNAHGASISFVFYTSGDIQAELFINGKLIPLTHAQDGTYRTQPVKITVTKITFFLKFNSKEDGTIRFKIKKDFDNLYESPYYYIPSAGNHRLSKEWTTGVKYGRRDSIDRFMQRMAMEPDGLEAIDLFYQDGKETELQEANITIPIYYATDRDRQIDKNGQLKGYGGTRSDLSYGIGEVKIPSKKRKGEIPRPPWWIPKWPENPEKHVTILNLTELSSVEYLAQFKKELSCADSMDILLFIHGYNESFASSVRRAAQLSYDTNFEGVTAVFSWPSANALLGYLYDQVAVDWAVKDLKQLLINLKDIMNGQGKIHVIAHSMGNEPMTRALVQLKDKKYFDNFTLSQLILAAPDLDQKNFERDTADELISSSERVTLYANEKDRALWVSKIMRRNQARLGTFQKTKLIDGIDVVNATKVNTKFLGHGYFSDTKPLIDDIRKLIKLGQPPADRELISVLSGHGQYWEFNKKR